MKDSISVIVPVYGGSRTLRELCQRTATVLKSLSSEFEIILVDDQSKDCWPIIQSLCKENSFVKAVRFAKNRGQQRAILCGFGLAKYDYVVTLDDDLQQSPEDIPLLYNEIKASGCDIVIAKYKRKKHSLIRNFGTKLVKNVISRSIGVPKSLDLTSFRIIRQYIVKEAGALAHPKPVIGFLLFSVTSNIKNLELEHSRRQEGASSYSIKGLIDYFFLQLFEYSDLPLKFLSYTGFFVFMSSVILSLVFLVQKLVWTTTVSGFTTIVLLLCGFGGLILLALGIIGRYLSRVLYNLGREPIYVIKESINTKN